MRRRELLVERWGPECGFYRLLGGVRLGEASDAAVIREFRQGKTRRCRADRLGVVETVFRFSRERPEPVYSSGIRELLDGDSGHVVSEWFR